VSYGELDLGDRILSFSGDPIELAVTVILDDDRAVYLGQRVSVRVYDRTIVGTIMRYVARQHTTAIGDPTGLAELDINLDLGRT
jgi:hypothetical protein